MRGVVPKERHPTLDSAISAREPSVSKRQQTGDQHFHQPGNSHRCLSHGINHISTQSISGEGNSRQNRFTRQARMCL